MYSPAVECFCQSFCQNFCQCFELAVFSNLSKRIVFIEFTVGSCLRDCMISCMMQKCIIRLSCISVAEQAYQVTRVFFTGPSDVFKTFFRYSSTVSNLVEIFFRIFRYCVQFQKPFQFFSLFMDFFSQNGLARADALPESWME